MSKFQPVIKWTGSKRTQADAIINLMPKEIDTYYEPFVGGGSVFARLAEYCEDGLIKVYKKHGFKKSKDEKNLMTKEL